MTRTGDREIGVVSGRLPDNTGELACMQTVNPGMVFRVLLDRKSVKVGDERSTYCGVKNVIPCSLAIVA